MFELWLYAYQTKARNQGNTVAATNPVFDLKITSYDLKQPLMTSKFRMF